MDGIILADVILFFICIAPMLKTNPGWLTVPK